MEDELQRLNQVSEEIAGDLGGSFGGWRLTGMWCIHQNFSLPPESTGVPLREQDAAQQAADGRGRAETGSQCRAGLRGSDPLAGS